MPNKAELLAGLLDANGDVLAGNLDNVSVAFADVTSKPTTLAGYGITDAASSAQGTNADTAYGWGDHSTQGYATTTYVDGEVANLVAAAPATLDTLNELAAALGDDANFSTTVTNSIATKAPIDQPQFTYNSGAGEAARIDSSGNLLISKTTASTTTAGVEARADGLLAATKSGAKALNLNRLTDDGDIAVFQQDGTKVGAIGSSGTSTYLDGVGGLLYYINGNEKMKINASGNVGIGESSPSAPLHITTTSQGTLPALQADADNLLIEDSTAGITLMGATTGGGMLAFGDTADADVGRIFYYHVSDYMGFWTNAAERMRLESDGDLHADGDVIAYSTTISDERLKTNIQGIENAVAKVSQLNGYTFEYTADGKVSAGVIAQEVEQVLPEAVSEKQLPLKADDGQEYKVVNYDALHGLLIEAVKELAARVEALEAK